MAYQELKVELEGRLATLQTRLASIKRDVTQGHSGDSAEQAQRAEPDDTRNLLAVVEPVGPHKTEDPEQVTHQYRVRIFILGHQDGSLVGRKRSLVASSELEQNSSSS